MEFNSYIDHTLLKPTATTFDIIKLCQEAITFSFYAVCVNGSYVALARDEIADSKVKVVAVIGFPLGSMSSETKLFETKKCIDDGADEIDMVINIGRLKAGENDYVLDEIQSVKKTLGEKLLKVIIETCFLTREEKVKACELVVKGGADYIKTSTGFGTGGATPEDVELIKKQVGNRIKIKASGGIKDRKTAEKYIELGVSRIGTSSGVDIVSSK